MFPGFTVLAAVLQGPIEQDQPIQDLALKRIPLTSQRFGGARIQRASASPPTLRCSSGNVSPRASSADLLIMGPCAGARVSPAPDFVICPHSRFPHRPDLWSGEGEQVPIEMGGADVTTPRRRRHLVATTSTRLELVKRVGYLPQTTRGPARSSPTTGGPREDSLNTMIPTDEDEATTSARSSTRVRPDSSSESTPLRGNVWSVRPLDGFRWASWPTSPGDWPASGHRRQRQDLPFIRICDSTTSRWSRRGCPGFLPGTARVGGVIGTARRSSTPTARPRCPRSRSSPGAQWAAPTWR